MNKQQIAKEALAKTWAWVTEEGADRRNGRAFMGDYARVRRVDLDALEAAPENMDWVAFCEDLVRGLNRDDSETRECAREWSDGGWYDESSGKAASMLYREMRTDK